MEPSAVAAQIDTLREMVQRSRIELHRTGDIYVVWGVVLIGALLGQLGLYRAGIEPTWVVWFVATPIGAIYAAFRGQQEAARRTTFASRVEARVWLLLGLALTGLAAGGPASGVLPVQAVMPMICALVGVALGTSGALYRTRPLSWSGALFLTLSFVLWFVDWPVQSGLLAGAFLVGYVLPGLWMMRSARSHA